MRPHINPFEKRRKEFARKERQKKKAERREIRDREKAERPAGNAEEDPDIAGIVPDRNLRSNPSRRADAMTFPAGRWLRCWVGLSVACLH